MKDEPTYLSGGFHAEAYNIGGTVYICELYDSCFEGEDGVIDESYGTAVIDIAHDRAVIHDFFINDEKELAQFLETVDDDDWDELIDYQKEMDFYPYYKDLARNASQ